MIVVADSSALVAWAAKHEGLIPAVKPYLDQLRESRLRFSESVLSYTLDLAGESNE